MAQGPRLILALALVLVVAVGTMIASAQTPGQFDKPPGPPLPVTLHPTAAEFDFAIAGGLPGTSFTNLVSMQAQHGPNCEGPPNSHEVHTHEDSVYICANHVMTALNAPDYGQIVITPHRLLDWSAGPAVVQWEMSTEKMSQRDWVDFTISPYMDNVAIEDFNQGAWPRIGVNIREDGEFFLRRIEGHEIVYDALFHNGSLSSGIAASTNQAAVRQTFKITLTRTKVKFERLPSTTGQGIVYFDQEIGDIGFSQGVVQFGQHSYNPTKAEEGRNSPATWHWDNFVLSPSQPINAIRANIRAVERADQVVRFNAPAPANAFLRFHSFANSDQTEVSFDNGQTWQFARRTNTRLGSALPDSYFHPIPAGIQDDRFRHKGVNVCSQDYHGGCQSRDFSIWSLGAQPPPASTQTPITTSTATAIISTPTPVPTGTPPPPVSTSSPQPTAVLPTSTPAGTRTCWGLEGTARGPSSPPVYAKVACSP